MKGRKGKIGDKSDQEVVASRVKRKHGGEVHRSGCECPKCSGGKVDGEKGEDRADRKPRKSGGAVSNPLAYGGK